MVGLLTLATYNYVNPHNQLLSSPVNHIKPIHTHSYCCVINDNSYGIYPNIPCRKNKKIACSAVNTYKMLHVQSLIKLLALFKKELQCFKFLEAIHMPQYLSGLSYFQFCTFTLQIHCNACRDSTYCWEDPCPHLIKNIYYLSQ